RDAVIDGSRIEESDILIGLPSNGLHTNGYSLVRKILNVGRGGDRDEERSALESNYPGLETTLADALLKPHHSYLNDVRRLLHPAPSTQYAALKGMPTSPAVASLEMFLASCQLALVPA